MDVRDLRRKVARHFYDSVDEDANPSVVALALQDNSSVGLQRHITEFHELHDRIKDFLKERVDESYEGFMESAGVYRYVVEALKTSNEGLQGSKSHLAQVHGQLSDRKSELRDLHKKSIRYKRKLEILSHLEELQQSPSKYEACVARKEFLQARQMLEQVLEFFNLRNSLNHPCIQPLTGYVQTQQVQLVTQLGSELRSTSFMEGPYAQKRLEYSKALLVGDAEYTEFMNNLPVSPDVNPGNPESNTFAYLGYVMQTLAGLSGLADHLDNLQRRKRQDLDNLMRVTTYQVIKDLKLTPEFMQRVTHGQTLLEQFRLIDQGALSLLAKSLFAKSARVSEAERAITEIARLYGITYDFDSICNAVVAMIKQFLLRYIGGQSAPAHSKSKIPQRSSASDSASKFSKSVHKGPIFEFGPGDEDSKSLRDFEALRESSKKSVPGLLADDPHHLFAETREKQKLEVVAPAHILNIRPLLEPSAALLAKAKTSTKNEKCIEMFDRFLDGFLKQSFVPRLQESFEEAIIEISEDDMALEQMPTYRTKSQLPIMTCASQFAETVGLSSQILDTGANFRAEYADISIGLLESVTSFFQTQVTNLFDQSSSIAPQSYRSTFRFATFMAQPALHKALSNRFKGNPDSTTEFDAYFSKRYSDKTPARSVISIQDLSDVNMFKQATLLITSIRWFILRLEKMRKVDKSGGEAKSNDDISSRVRKRWTLLDASSNLTATSDISLSNSSAILRGQSLSKFDAVIEKLEDCASNALSTLRADLFLRIVYYFDQMVINRDYHSTNRGEERDPVVDRLQQELSLESQIFEEHLLPSDCEFLLGDIAEFMTRLFILEGENIKDMNESGQNQILTNIFASQQMSTSIVADPREVDFSRASSFYELFRLNPTLIIDKVREGETDLGQEDSKLLLEIRHRNAGSTSTFHAFGNLSNHLVQLNSIFNESQFPASAAINRTTSSPASSVSTNASNQSVPKPTRSGSVASVASVASKSSVDSRRSQESVTSPNQTRSGPAETSSRRALDERSRTSVEQKRRQQEEAARQREHDRRNASEAERLRTAREQLKSRPSTGSIGGSAARDSESTTSHRQTQMTSAPGSASGHRQAQTSSVPISAAGHRQAQTSSVPVSSAGHRQTQMSSTPTSAAGLRQSQTTSTPSSTAGHRQSQATSAPAPAAARSPSLNRTSRFADAHKPNTTNNDSRSIHSRTQASTQASATGNGTTGYAAGHTSAAQNNSTNSLNSIRSTGHAAGHTSTAQNNSTSSLSSIRNTSHAAGHTLTAQNNSTSCLNTIRNTGHAAGHASSAHNNSTSSLNNARSNDLTNPAHSGSTSSLNVPPLRQKRSARSLPKMQVNTALLQKPQSGPSPVTPDQPPGQGRIRTPSERALEASQRVRARPKPSSQSRGPSN